MQMAGTMRPFPASLRKARKQAWAIVAGISIVFFCLVTPSHCADADGCGPPADSDQFSVKELFIDDFDMSLFILPVIRVDNAGRVHALTMKKGEANKLYYLNDDAGSLRVMAVVETQAADHLKFTMEIDRLEQAQIVFSLTHQSIGSTYPTPQYDYQSEIFYTQIIDGQALSPVSVSTASENIYRLLLSIDQQNGLHIGYTSATESMEQALLSNFSYTTNRLGEFSRPAIIASNVPELMNLNLNVDDSGYAYAFGIVHAWQTDGFSIQRWTMDPQGEVSAETVYSNQDKGDFAEQILNLDVAKNSDNAFHLMFQEADLYYANDLDGSFGTPEKIADLRDDASWMGGAVELIVNENDVHAVFNEPQEDSCWNLYYYCRQDGDAPSATRNAGVAGKSAPNFCLKIDDQGYLHWIFGGYTAFDEDNHWLIYHAKSREPVADPAVDNPSPESASSNGGCFVAALMQP
jgi:hypothetical protein